MKRLLTVLGVVAVVLTVGGVWAFSVWAQGPTVTPAPTRPFVDENGDGVCDVCGRTPGEGFLDEDGDGVCDTRAQSAGQGCGMMRGANGQGFVDEDGDGLCDTRGQTSGAGRGRGMMRRGQAAGQGQTWGMMAGSRGCGATVAPAEAPTN